MNAKVIEEINDIFERMHAKLDYRFQQLIRQLNRKNGTTLNFSPINQMQLEENIQKFGRLTISTSLNNIERLTNSTSTSNMMYSILSSRQQTMRRTTLASAIPKDTYINNEHCRIIGKRGRQKGQFSNPQDVLILTNPNRTLLVSDTINQNVQLFSFETGVCTGRFLSSINSKQIPLRRPIGLSKTFIDSSTCFVTDYDQHLISHWTIDENGNGKLIKKFGQKSLLGPKGICVSKQSEKILVADNKANSICLFDSSGVFLHRFGTRGAELHELAGPHYVQFADEDNDRHIIVTDFYNNCVKIFDRQGTFIRPIELPISDMLYGPQGLDYEPISQTLAIANSGKHSAILIHID